jgi:hypothetical protein
MVLVIRMAEGTISPPPFVVLFLRYERAMRPRSIALVAQSRKRCAILFSNSWRGKKRQITGINGSQSAARMVISSPLSEEAETCAPGVNVGESTTESRYVCAQFQVPRADIQPELHVAFCGSTIQILNLVSSALDCIRGALCRKWKAFNLQKAGDRPARVCPRMADQLDPTSGRDDAAFLPRFGGRFAFWAGSHPTWFGEPASPYIAEGQPSANTGSGIPAFASGFDVAAESPRACADCCKCG